MQAGSRPLPIDRHLSEIVATVGESGALVLQAEPGAGKTTRVPGALLEAGVAGAGSVLVLEPRRVAARAAADFVAKERGERVGATVGYQVRFERRGDDDTKVWFVTEGIAVRRLASDPFLDGVGVIVLDEFHERHLAGDMVLAVARELRTTVRPDLKIVVMSATLDVERVAAFLGDCPVLRCSGRGHPVEVEYVDRPREQRLHDAVLDGVRRVSARPECGGDVLVFLPGRGEIARCAGALAEDRAAADFEVCELHGELPLDRQRRVLARTSASRRIVLSTNVAESSVTVDGVDTVIDTGVAKVPEIDAGRGLERLRSRPISVASADQRSGRAGRQRPGFCLRLWSRHDHSSRRKLEVPEIQRLDLASLVLDLRAWGLRDFTSFGFLDTPPSRSLDAAHALLVELGAVTGDGEVSEIGRRMMQLPASPRIARMLVAAEDFGCGDDGAIVAALLGERDLIRDARTTSLSDRLEAFRRVAASKFAATECRAAGVDPGVARAVERGRRQLAGGRGEEPKSGDGEVARALLAAFPDRVIRRRPDSPGRGVMVGGGGVRLGRGAAEELLLGIEVRAGARQQHSESAVDIDCVIERRWLEEDFSAAMADEVAHELDPDSGVVVVVERRSFRDLVLDESRSPCRDGSGAALLAAHVAKDTRTVLGLGKEPRALLDRIDFARRFQPELRSSGDYLDEVGVAACAGKNTLAEVRRVDVSSLVLGLLSFEQRRALDQLAPLELRLPRGRRAKIDYSRGEKPVVAGKIQELFGLKESPTVANGRVPLLVEILGPNYRPVQLTDDLASFWKVTYPQVRKELRGRYPKHAWPEDPTVEEQRGRN